MVKIENFTDLTAWQESHKLVLSIYKLVKKFPRTEIFGLTNQMQRAVISVTSNIAEGFPRRSRLEKIRFYSFSLASLAELHNQLIAARDLKYISKTEFDNLLTQVINARKLINGLVKSSPSR